MKWPVCILLLLCFTALYTQNGPAATENDFYRITTIPVPEGIELEVGGLTTLSNGEVAVCTRRGDLWLVQNPTMINGNAPKFNLFASGLHEPLGLLYHNGSYYTAQRGELTKLTDTDGDAVADDYSTLYSWPLTGNYHEYSFGPGLAPDGSFFVTTNISFPGKEWWRGRSMVPWRGWTLKISEDGKMKPWATGMRSPAGYGIIDGEFFFTDNQGDWKGSGGLWHVPLGAFTGHPAGLVWSQEPDSPVKLTADGFSAKIDRRQIEVEGRKVKPENINDEKNPLFEYQAAEYFREFQMPAVVLPHGILGISNSEIKADRTGGKFGPFENQIFIGDQGQSKIMRVVLEKVDDVYQGVAFDFRSGFQSGVLRMDFDFDGNLFVGETNRGWGSAGGANYGLEYLTWTGKVPFEMKNVKAMPDGFEIEFTKEVDIETAENLDSYKGKSYIYKYHPAYGSPQTNLEDIEILGVKVSDDLLRVRVVVKNMRKHYVHEFTASMVKSKSEKQELLHPTFYYTLNNIPEGTKLLPSQLSVKRTAKKVVLKKSPSLATKKPKTVLVTPLTYDDVLPLLNKNTCIACHNTEKRVIGPSFKAIAKRKYSDEKIVDLIYNPQPKNWPEYATPMAAMPHVDKNEALKIAAWINTLAN